MSPWRAVGATLVLAAALAAPPRGVDALPVHDVPTRTPAQDTVASPEPLRTPAEVVAARARDLLRDHADRRAWGELAVALPSVAAADGRGPDATVEATRVVEAMLRELPPQEADGVDSSTPPAAAAPALAVSSSSARTSDRRSIGEMIDVLASALALLLGVFALAMVMKGAGSALRPTTSSATPDRGRHRDVRLMAERGLQAHEIARRTGLARDAVSVLINRKAG